MPPKKTKSPMPEEKPPEKVVKKRVRAVKPNLKIPTVVKVKIPSDPSLYTGPKLTRKQLTTQIKIDLANEVARAQLVKPELVLMNNVPEVKPVRRRRAKKVISEFFSDADTPAPAVASDPLVKTEPELPNNVSEVKPVRRGRAKKVILDFSSDADTPAPAVASVQLVKSEPMLMNNVSEVKPVRRGRAKKAILDFSSDADTPAPAVASAPLVESEPVLLNNIPEVKPARRGRAKKAILDVSSDADTPAPAEPPKKTIKLIRPKPTGVIETEKKPIATAKKRVTNSTDKPKSAKKARVIKTKTGITNCKTTCEPTKDLIVTKSKIIRKSRPRRVKGKANKPDDISTDNAHSSPSILQTVFEKASPTKATSEDQAAVPIGSRKTSVNSNSSISWTKDISSSSTTTCVTVTSNDFVRINNKMPIVSLTNVDSDLKRRAAKVEESSSSSSSSSDSDSSSSVSQTTPDVNSSLLDVNTQHLDLSASSPSVSKHNDSPQSVARHNVSPIGAALDRLSAQLKRFDIEMVNWIGYENETKNDDVKKFHDKITEVFKNECDVIIHCRQIKKVLTDETDKDVEKSAYDAVSPEKSRDYIEFDITNADNLDISNNDFDGDTYFDSEENDNILENYNKNIKPPVSVRKELSSSDSENFTSDKVRYIPFDVNNDDDDALSLFAESITGFESSKMNSSIPSTSSVQHDEYIPEPVTKTWEKSSPDKLVYFPTKKTHSANDQLILNNRNKSICEKQNADSTSIKEPEICKSVDNNFFIVPNKQISVHKDFVSEFPRIRNGNVPGLMASRYKRLHGQKSMVFRGICFFNLLSSCKNQECRFPHIELSKIELKNRLTRLSEDLFIQEYMMMRNWPSLRRKYGLCFVEECQRRDLTRILVEMSMDSIIKANFTSKEDAVLKTEVIEFTLLHLNMVNINDYQDFLMYKVSKGSLLCDVYMEVISETQNFSRFKLVFLNLIQFIIGSGRTFKLSVTEHILERVCILPYEEPLVRAVVKMIHNTDSSILQNSMMGLFEKQLMNVGTEFYEEFVEFKKQASLIQRVVVNPFIESPPLLNEVETVAVVNNTQMDRGERYTSPDTTNLDSLNKVTDEPIITRTININPSRHMGFQQSLPPTVTTDKEDYRPKNQFSHWKNKSILLKMFNGFSSQMHPPQIRPPLTPPANLQVNHRQVTYNPSPTKFPRRSAPDF